MIQKPFYLEVNNRDYEEGYIVRLAKKKQFSPAQFAKIILEEYHKELEGEESVSKDKISKLIKNTALIQDQKLATEIWLATVKDNNYGPSSECIKCAIGNDYENQAKRSLERLGIAYQDEHDLRAKGNLTEFEFLNFSKKIFSNFSCMFLKPNICFQFEFELF